MPISRTTNILSILIILSVAIASIYMIHKAHKKKMFLLELDSQVNQHGLKPINSNKNGSNFDEMSGKQFINFMNDHHGPIMVIFTSHGCVHCSDTLPKFKQASSFFTNIPFINVDASSAGSLMQKYNIQGVPTILMLQSGHILKEYIGDRSVQSFVEFTKNYNQ